MPIVFKCEELVQDFFNHWVALWTIHRRFIHQVFHSIEEGKMLRIGEL